MNIDLKELRFRIERKCQECKGLALFGFDPANEGHAPEDDRVCNACNGSGKQPLWPSLVWIPVRLGAHLQVEEEHPGHGNYVHALSFTVALDFLGECYGWDTTKQYAHSLESRGARLQASCGTSGTVDAEADSEAELMDKILAKEVKL